MESIYTELALYGSKNECARTEVCDGTVSLMTKEVKHNSSEFQGSHPLNYPLLGSGLWLECTEKSTLQ